MASELEAEVEFLRNAANPSRRRMARREIARRADIAYREVMMSQLTKADKARIQLMWDALWALDQEQADAKEEIDRLKAAGK